MKRLVVSSLLLSTSISCFAWTLNITNNTNCPLGVANNIILANDKAQHSFQFNYGDTATINQYENDDQTCAGTMAKTPAQARAVSTIMLASNSVAFSQHCIDNHSTPLLTGSTDVPYMSELSLSCNTDEGIGGFTGNTVTLIATSY